MAPNFEIAVDKISDGFCLKLEGGFDATSAYEVIDAIGIYIFFVGRRRLTGTHGYAEPGMVAHDKPSQDPSAY